VTCNITVQSNGGNGGSVTDAASHGGGAGGGVGIIEETHPTSNTFVKMQSAVGIAGKDCAGCTSNTATPAVAPSFSKKTIPSVPGGGVITLPVKLVNFTASLADRQVELNWTTATEENNDYFTIERSENGTDFDSVMSLRGAGNSTVQLKYSEMDNTPVTTAAVYYRLKQTDFNGAYEYSRVIRLDTHELMPADGLTMYPNPASDKLMVNNLNEGGVTVRIFSDRGTTVFNNSTTEAEMPIDVSHIPNGVYTVEIVGSGKRKVEKLIIRH